MEFVEWIPKQPEKVCLKGIKNNRLPRRNGLGEKLRSGMEFTKMSQNPYSGEGENRQVFYASEMKVSSLLSTFLEITIRKRDHFYVGFCVFHPAGVLLGSDWMKNGLQFSTFRNFTIGACFQSKKCSVSWKEFNKNREVIIFAPPDPGKTCAGWKALFGILVAIRLGSCSSRVR